MDDIYACLQQASIIRQIKRFWKSNDHFKSHGEIMEWLREAIKLPASANIEEVRTTSTLITRWGKLTLYPLTTTRATIVAHAFLVITRHLLQLDRCSNPLRMRKVFLVLLKKNFFYLGEGFVWERLAKWGCFCFLELF